jgi:DNA-binding GntR family transcriptional regulator
MSAFSIDTNSVGRSIQDHPGRSDPIYLTIYSVLRDHVERHALLPGLVLGQANIARAFNVSRIPAGIALSRLCNEGLIETFQGRGFVVPGGKPLRRDLFASGLRLPSGADTPAMSRRDQIYPEVEHAILACLAYGRFLLNETALAQHYDVSRTIAHEVLTQLARGGVIEQDSNNRWYAGPLLAEHFAHHYEMRWLLEPQALHQAFPFIGVAEIGERIERIEAAKRDGMIPRQVELLEEDLHLHTLSPCANKVLLSAVRKSQRLLITTHSTFMNQRSLSDIALMAAEHTAIFTAIRDGDLAGACSILVSHLKRSLDVNIGMLEKLRDTPTKMRPPYLIQVK